MTSKAPGLISLAAARRPTPQPFSISARSAAKNVQTPGHLYRSTGAVPPCTVEFPYLDVLRLAPDPFVGRNQDERKRKEISEATYLRRGRRFLAAGINHTASPLM